MCAQKHEIAMNASRRLSLGSRQSGPWNVGKAVPHLPRHRVASLNKAARGCSWGVMKTGYGFSHYAFGLAVRLHPCQSQHLPNTSWSSGTKYRQELVPPANISQICQSHFWSATQDKLISPNPATARECAFLPPGRVVFHRTYIQP